MALGTSVANDIANAILKNYLRGPTLSQTMTDRPLLRFLMAGKKTFPGGNQYISDPVQGAYMSDASGQISTLGGGAFFSGYTEDDALSFAQGQNILRAEYRWYEVHSGLVITWTELKKDGITITDNNKKSMHGDMELTRLVDLLENRMDDFGESWARSMNAMLWRDGSQDAKQVPGVRSVLTDATGTGTIGGLSRATYSWWNHRVALGLASSPANQTLSKKLRTEQRQLRKYMGKPNKFLAGSDFIDKLENEVAEKGYYTQEGFTSEGKTDIGLADISLRGVGRFEYDSSMDDLGLGSYCLEFDSRRIKLRPMEGEDMKTVNPERPYQYMVFLKSMTWTGTLQFTQLNAFGVYSAA